MVSKLLNCDAIFFFLVSVSVVKIIQFDALRKGGKLLDKAHGRKEIAELKISFPAGKVTTFCLLLFGNQMGDLII